MSAAPKLIANFLGDPNLRLFMKRAEILNLSEAPQVYNRLAAATKQMHTVTLQAALYDSAAALRLTNVRTVATPALLNKVRRQEWKPDDVNKLENSLSPFMLGEQTATLRYPELALAALYGEANYHAMLDEHRQLLAQSTIVLPTTIHEVIDQLQAFQVLLYTLLGPHHSSIKSSRVSSRSSQSVVRI